MEFIRSTIIFTSKLLQTRNPPQIGATTMFCTLVLFCVRRVKGVRIGTPPRHSATSISVTRCGLLVYSVDAARTHCVHGTNGCVRLASARAPHALDLCALWPDHLHSSRAMFATVVPCGPACFLLAGSHMCRARWLA